MKLGVPTLCRYDLLDELLKSAERGTVRPSGYIIIDNGNAYPRERLNDILGERASAAELVSPGTNIGVAASWNRILESTQDDLGVVISNDDIELGEKTFEELSAALETHPFVEGDGWALFGQTSGLTDAVGYYDENFWPAYYEDVDIEERLRRLGVAPFNPLSTPVKHHGWATTRSLGDAAWLAEGRARNHAYFLRKWGGESRAHRWNGHPGIFQYEEPFNGNPPPGWSLRTKRKESLMVMRWDVLNHIAKQIGARRYLEIGVADGSCMRQIDVAEKWGVDPAPSVESVKSATVFVPHTSDEFFATVAERAGKFDLVFIDGDHIAEQVLREVASAVKLLSTRGVIVLHDCNPHTEAMQEVPWRAGEWTGDVWKAVVRLRRAGYTLRVINSDYGIGVLLPSSPTETPPVVPDENLTWAHLVEHRDVLLGLIEPWDWEAWFDATRY